MKNKFKAPTSQGLTPIFGLPINDEHILVGPRWVSDIDETTGIVYTFCVPEWPLFLSREDVPE
jgi:hypothetical protein